MFKNQSETSILGSSANYHCTPQTTEGVRTPDDIIRKAKPTTEKQERVLLDFSHLAHHHPEVVPRLAELVSSRLGDNRAASVHECFERLRWDLHLHMPNGLAPLLARAVLYSHPELNGMVRLVPVPLDEALGMRVSERKLPGDYARRLEWYDGRPLEASMPILKKNVKSVRPTQGELFEVA
jgi:hypothetical protein